jgi:Flp pilus assembly protein TadG
MFLSPVPLALSSRRRRSGAAAVEFAFVCMPLLTFVMGAIELGRGLMVVEYMGNAARQACRYAAVQPTPTDGTNLTNIQNRATNTLAIALVKKSAVTVTVTYYNTSANSYAIPSSPPPAGSTGNNWLAYPNSSATASSANGHPASGDYVNVNVQVSASGVTWLPFYWFLRNNQTFSVDEDMVIE